MLGYEFSQTYSYFEECKNYDSWVIVSKDKIERAEKIMSQHRNHTRNTISIDNPLLLDTNLENQTATQPTHELGFSLRLNAKTKKALEELVGFLKLNED